MESIFIKYILYLAKVFDITNIIPRSMLKVHSKKVKLGGYFDKEKNSS
jgi:hypothetical protein